MQRFLHVDRFRLVAVFCLPSKALHIGQPIFSILCAWYCSWCFGMLFLPQFFAPEAFSFCRRPTQFMRFSGASGSSPGSWKWQLPQKSITVGFRLELAVCWQVLGLWGCLVKASAKLVFRHRWTRRSPLLLVSLWNVCCPTAFGDVLWLSAPTRALRSMRNRTRWCLERAFSCSTTLS